jgi:hypothetical protein
MTLVVFENQGQHFGLLNIDTLDFEALLHACDIEKRGFEIKRAIANYVYARWSAGPREVRASCWFC